MARDRRPPLQSVGDEPDPRFSFANERTFPAWNRTALAMVAAGLAVTSLLPAFNVAGGRRLIGVPLIVLGAVLSYASYRRREANERAMRLRRPLPTSYLIELLTIGVVIASLLAAIIAAFGSKRS